ncbi:MAG: hypothetical protein ACYCPQ_02740 [Elusimicrobiota bacterium]
MTFVRRAALIAAAVVLLADAPSSAATPNVLQRKLFNLSLGESLWRVRRAYPGAASCPATSELSGRIRRVRLAASCAKSLPPHVRYLWLGFEGKRLAELQAVYDAEFTRKKSADGLADDFALIYGLPRQSQGKFWWADGKTVLRVFEAELDTKSKPSAGAASFDAVRLRTSVQIMDVGLFK